MGEYLFMIIVLGVIVQGFIVKEFQIQQYKHKFKVKG